MSKFIFAAAVLGAPAQPHNNILHAPDNGGGGGAGVLDADFKKSLLDGLGSVKATVEGTKAQISELDAAFALIKSENEHLQKANADVVAKFLEFQKQRLAGSQQRSSRPGFVSEDCARFLGAIGILDQVQQDKFQDNLTKQRAASIFKEITGVECKTALTTSDIPMPTGFSGEVAELVGMYGTARTYGTVMPLPNGIFKMPKLGTDTAFGLLAIATAITEKSPTITNVTFTAEKFGGMIRLPNEIDEDSVVAMGQFIARYGARRLAEIEDWNFWASTGGASGKNGTAEGLVKSVVTDSKTTVSGVLGSPSEFTLTHFRTLRTIPDATALRNGAYYMHPSFEQLLNTFNTSGNKPYNPQAQIMGSGANPFTTGPTLDGFPIRWIDVLPAYTTSDALSTVHVLFGDASYNYLGVRKGPEFATSKEAGFATDETLIRIMERFTIGKMATGCVGGLITHSA